MMTKATRFGLVLGATGVLAVMVSCSGSTDSNDAKGGSNSGGSASAGKGGTSAAGTSSSGSSSGGNHASGGNTNNNGGTRNGGGNATGGFTFGGGFNLGGAGFDPADYMCNPVPTAGTACPAGTQPCLNDTAVCYCQMNKWACLDVSGGLGGAGPGGFGQLDCPATAPMTGEACGDTVGFCQYGQNMGCACYQGMWACN
jgi:hypothetical protein